MILIQFLDYLDIARHYAGHYGGLALLWYWAQPAGLQVRLYAGPLCVGAVVGRLLHWRLWERGR